MTLYCSVLVSTPCTVPLPLYAHPLLCALWCTTGTRLLCSLHLVDDDLLVPTIGLFVRCRYNVARPHSLLFVFPHVVCSNWYRAFIFVLHCHFCFWPPQLAFVTHSCISLCICWPLSARLIAYMPSLCFCNIVSVLMMPRRWLCLPAPTMLT